MGSFLAVLSFALPPCIKAPNACWKKRRVDSTEVNYIRRYFELCVCVLGGLFKRQPHAKEKVDVDPSYCRAKEGRRIGKGVGGMDATQGGCSLLLRHLPQKRMNNLSNGDIFCP